MAPKDLEVFSTWDPTEMEISPDLEAASRRLVEVMTEEGKRVENGRGTAIVNCVRDGYGVRVDLRECCYFKGILREYGSRQNDPALGPIASELMKKYAQPDSFRQGFPHRLGLAVNLITADGFMAVVQRSSTVAVGAGKIGPSVSGGIRPDRGDCDRNSNIPSLAIIRQTHEELGIELDLSKDRLIFTSISLDPIKFFQPNLVGFVRLHEVKRDDLLALADAAGDKWERQKLSTVEAKPESILPILGGEMDTITRVALNNLVECVA